jgi:trimeric autotransporter adhesin
MSTKTTFKRIALVAVAALGFGTLSVAPSNAYATLWGISAVTPSNTGTTNVAVKSLVAINFTGTTAETNISGSTVISTPAGSAVTCSSLSYSANTNTAYTNTNVTLGNQAGAAGTSSVWYVADECATNNTAGGGNFVNGLQIKQAAAGYSKAYFNVGFTPDKAGTYVVRVYAAPLATKDAFYTDLTFTVTDPVVQSIKAYLNTDTTTATSADASSLSYAAASNVTAKGALVVQQYSTTDTTTVAVTAISQAVTVTISKGLVSKTNDYFAGAKSVTTAAAGSTNGRSEYYVFANGEVGSATLTVTVGALTSTKTITFQGVAATLSAALTAGQPTWISPTAGSNNTTTVTVTAKDSAGNAASNTPTITATPASTAVATAAVNGLVVTITGVAAGTTVVTIADSAAVAASTTYTVTVAPVQSATLPTLTFDKAEYAAGELMTITVAAAAADNASFVAFTGLPTVSVNVITTTNPFSGGNTGTVALVGGKATWKAYAPITPGPVVITATSSSGSSVTSAAGNVTATATVLSDGVAQAAVDAAAEAIDAANAATDAANAAAEAADAATAAAQDAADAVAALSVSVAAMIDALKKQITSLTNLVIKIQKKVKA